MGTMGMLPKQFVCKTCVKLFEEAKQVPNSTRGNVADGSRTTGHQAIAVAVHDLLNGFFANYELQPTYAIHRGRDEMHAFVDE
jgi:hypothetical protein